MGIGKTIKLLRINAGFKQKDLAVKVGVSQNYLSLVENDKRQPSLSFLRSVAEGLRVPSNYLILEILAESLLLEEKELEVISNVRQAVAELQRVSNEKKHER